MRPKYFVRVILKRTNALECLTRLLTTKSKEVAEEFVQWVFGGESTWSVYELKQCHRLDEGHAFGLLAVTIGNQSFDAAARAKCAAKVNRWAVTQAEGLQTKRDNLGELIKYKPPMTLVLPSEAFDERFIFTHSPENNLTFLPADELHYDISGVEVERFAKPILNAIVKETATITVLTPEDFRTQAAIALSSCLRKYAGCILPSSPPGKTHKLTSIEQSERLRTIAGDFGWQSLVIENSTLPSEPENQV